MSTYNNEELSHHGIIGQRWGVRRYQNRDGSLTPAGRKRANKLASDYKSLTGKNINKKKEEKPKNDLYTKKNSNEMTDEELRARTNRLNLENNYTNAINNYQKNNPKQVSLGKRFIDKVMKDVIVPASTEVAKGQVQKFMREAIKKAEKKSKK